MKVAVAIFSMMLLVVFLFWYFMPPQESRYTRQRIPLPEQSMNLPGLDKSATKQRD